MKYILQDLISKKPITIQNSFNKIPNTEKIIAYKLNLSFSPDEYIFFTPSISPMIHNISKKKNKYHSKFSPKKYREYVYLIVPIIETRKNPEKPIIEIINEAFDKFILLSNVYFNYYLINVQFLYRKQTVLNQRHSFRQSVPCQLSDLLQNKDSFNFLKFFCQLESDRSPVKQIQQKMQLMLSEIRNGENKTENLRPMKEQSFLSSLIYSIYLISLKIPINFKDNNFLEIFDESIYLC